ncbi:Bug family tripartite tricarboxylate transporter substrate binding protein [Dankookia sp. P2]|uniref:Bug family tripartite tricarboxylate transporter substrate binding protein n=1 Tax=Dankookia sp. P2 TaxID=3423955 RepID=UPI003D670696
MNHASRRGLLAAAAGTLAAPAFAQSAPDFPSRPVRFVLPAGPGSGVDIMTRLLADTLLRQTGRSFVIDNRVGAAGAIGARHAVTQPADGYTLFYGGPNFVILPVMNRAFAREIDIRTAFDPVTIAGSGPFVLVASPKVPARDIAEFVAWLRENPGGWDFATSGVGATVHLLCELFRLRIGGPPGTMVPYRGDGAAVQAVANGEAHWTIAVSGSTKPFVDTGAVRAMAATGPTRMAGLPEVPTLAETGLAPGIETTAWLAYFTPGGTPPDRIAWLQRAIAAAIHAPAIRERLDVLGFEPVGSDPEALRQVVARDLAMWTRVVQEARIPVD